jgi:hypothetical protein
MSSTEYRQGERIVPLERDANVFTKADHVVMPHTPGESSPPLPRPDSISDGTEPPPSTWASDRNAL